MKIFLKYTGILILILLWSTISGLGLVSKLIIPTPWSVAAAFSDMVKTSLFFQDLGITLYRMIMALLISCLLGVPIGLLMGYKLRLYKAFIFVVDFFRSIPPIALFPIFILAFGLGESSKIAVPVYGCVLIIIINSIYGVINAPAIRKNVAKVYGFTDTQIFYSVVVPDAVPHIVTGIRTAISLSLVLTIVVEMMLGGKYGLGKRIYDSYLIFEIPQMFALIITTGIIGYAINQLFIYIEKKIFHWKT